MEKILTEWDLSSLLSGDNDPKIEEKKRLVEEKAREFKEKWENRDDYLADPAVLKAALDEYENWSRNYNTGEGLGFYFWLRSEQDQNNPEIKAKFNQIQDFELKIYNQIQFFTHRIARIPDNLQSQFLQHKELEPYRHFLEKLFLESKYLLTEPEEKILNLKSPFGHSNWVRMTEGFLAKQERKVLDEVKNFSEILSLLDNKDKNVRDSAVNAFNDILEKYAEVAEAEMNSVLGNKKINDELRKMDRPDLSRHISDDINSNVVDVLIDAVSGRFEIPQKYYELKAKLFGVPKLAYHEKNVEYGTLDKHYDFNQGIDLVKKSLGQLSPKFSSVLEKYLQNGQIDVYPKKGKTSGAFMADQLPIHPSYMLLNYTNKLKDVLTLAHELGHGINSELMRKQNALNFGTTLATAEVASTFMEDFVVEEIIKDADDELKLSLMMMRLNNDTATIFRQIACYRFEQELHATFRQKGYLSKEEIGAIFQKHMASYMGDSVEQSKGSENWWVYWGHIRNFFYNYSYANGLLISKALQASVRQNPQFIEKVEEFLSAGLSDSPKNIFLKTGIDISQKDFWLQGLNEIENLLKETETLAKKLGKI